MPTVCVYAASSRNCHEEFKAAARRLGVYLAQQGFTIIYGGGGAGLMGCVADGALGQNGKVIGVLPQFMKDLEWGHTGLTELKLVEDMHTRKHQLLSSSDAVVALPGGSGTFDELLEAITLKRLGLYTGPIVLINTRGFFRPLLEQLDLAIREHFMDARHAEMWQVVAEPEEVGQAFKTAKPWSEEARKFATQ